MRLLISLLLAAGLGQAAELPYFSVLSDDAGAWPEILSSIGLVRRPASVAHVFVARAGSPASAEWNSRVEKGAILILEGESSLADMFGFRRGSANVKVASLIDLHQPSLPIVWENGLELPVFGLPPGARVFARERWNGAPMMAGCERGLGAVLWVAVPPGERGYERFPYLLQALADLGLSPTVPRFASVGLLRFRLPLARGPGLFRRALAQSRHCGPARGRLAFRGARCRTGCLARKADRGLPPRRHPGLRLAGTASRQRDLLERASGVARKDRHSAGRAARLAQTHEPGQSRLLPGRGGRSPPDHKPVRLGRRQPGRVVF